MNISFRKKKTGWGRSTSFEETLKASNKEKLIDFHVLQSSKILIDACSHKVFF